MNITALQQGMAARLHDDENGGLTDNPYSYDTEARREWYEGYRYEDEITREKNRYYSEQKLGETKP